MVGMLSADDKIDRSYVEMAESIMSGGQKINSLVEDFLDVSKFEAGRMELHPVQVDLASKLEELITGLLPEAKKKMVSLEAEVSGLDMVTVDKKYIERAVSNLLHNALNYTTIGGKVVLKAEAQHRVSEGRRSNETYVVISVQDTGLGIPEEEKGKIFDKYYRSSKTYGMKGTGLGLAVVKAVAEAHGGRVDVESEVGKGTTFRIYLPGEAEIKKAA
jgi:signal transduction histidine kinase